MLQYCTKMHSFWGRGGWGVGGGASSQKCIAYLLAVFMRVVYRNNILAKEHA